jgi:hypothetical protein
MSDEILNCITKDEESLSAYLSVNSINEETVFRYVLKEKVFPYLYKIAAKHELEFEESGGSLLQENYGFKFFIDFNEEWKDICVFFAFGEKLSDLRFGAYDNKTDKWLTNDLNPNGLRPMNKYRCWYWNKPEGQEVLKKLCCPNNDIVLEIDNKIAEFLPEIEAEIKKSENTQ